MSRALRVDFKNQFNQYIADGGSVADFVNLHTVKISKDSDYLSMVAAECCHCAQKPWQIDALFEQFMSVKNAQHRIDLIAKGFEFLVLRNWKRPEILNTWYTSLSTLSGRDYSTRLGKSWNILAHHPKACRTFIHYMNITPAECQTVMEIVILGLAQMNVYKNPELFIHAVPKIKTLSSTTKLRHYMNKGLSSLNHPLTLNTTFSSLDPGDRLTCFIQLCKIQHRSFRFESDFNVLRTYWESMIPHICKYLVKNSTQNHDALTREHLRHELAFIVALHHDYFFHCATAPITDAAKRIYDEIVIYEKMGHLYSTQKKDVKGLIEEMGNKIQSLRLLKQIEPSALSSQLKRKL